MITNANSKTELEMETSRCSYQKQNNTDDCTGCSHLAKRTCSRIWDDKEMMKWINQNMGLLNLTYHSFINPDILEFKAEDVKQEALISVLRASKAYDPAKGAKFATYACRAIKNNLLLMNRKKDAIKRTTTDGQSVKSLDAPSSAQDDSDYSDLYSQKMESICPNSLPEDVEEDLMCDDLQHLIYRIANEECAEEELRILDILVGSVEEGVVYTQDMIAKKIKCSQAKVSTTLGTLRGRLRLALADYGYYV